ncbi:TIGR03862 family flavoprotein [Pseudochelatococcus lubricantis]|uniref:TIGR03862 family flavoprotein n=1 Tax=Pseudochelatococcus lubricantis TaxID=1538102 RepID=UPI0035E7EBCC
MSADNETRRTVAVVGAGPAGLMAAGELARAGCAVTVYERMPSPARKFLMAGRGGLNLTHAEPLDKFLQRYGPARDWLEPAIRAFPPGRLRRWSADLGEPTFEGSSRRIFPRSYKATPLLRAWLRQLEQAGVAFSFRHCWLGFANGDLRFATPEGERVVCADAALLALGGGSWPRLGSDGGWVEVLRGEGIDVADLRPANCGFTVAWSDVFRARAEGEPLKRIALHAEGLTANGEAMITATGIEGGAVYALSTVLREAIARDGEATLTIDLQTGMSESELAWRLERARSGQSAATTLRKVAGLSPAAALLVREPGPLPTTARELAALVKGVPIRLTGTQPLARAISSAGGIHRAEIDDNYMLRKRPGVFAAGEMLDWEAPTGGYLLQATFATGHAAAAGILRYLESGSGEPPPPAVPLSSGDQR